MSKLVFRMRDVPDDEAQDVRALLDANGIDYFETFGGNWGISMPALWVKNPSEFSKARDIIDEYQSARAQRIEQGDLKIDEGEDLKTLGDSFRKKPFQFISYWLLIAVVLFISIYYFFSY
ncbi:MAG: DUF6164 family protein [Pseudohongiellaceae bacterium]